MPININDDEFPAGNDNTLNLIQIVRSQAHLIKKITGKDSWKDYPDLNLQTLSDLLESEELKGDKGNDGINGLSAYELAVSLGYTGTLTQWLASLKGNKGDSGINGINGLSAYQIALSNGFIGTESQWLASLKGEPGSTPNIDSLTTQVNNNTSAINAINAISRPRILWKTQRAISLTLSSQGTTFSNIIIPAGTCTQDSTLHLRIDIQSGNTSAVKTYTLLCNNVLLSSFNIGQNTTYTLSKKISFVTSLQAPITTPTNDLGFGNVAGNLIRDFADFSQNQTLIIRVAANNSTPSDRHTAFLLSGYLELI